MGIPQTSYALAPGIGRVGALASARHHAAVARVASVAVGFGLLTVRDADDLKAKLPTTAAEVLAACKGSGGVSIATHAIVSDGVAGIPNFPIKKEFAQLKRGQIFVLVEQDVNQGDQAYARYAAHTAAQEALYLAAEGGAADQKGAWRKDYDGTAQVTTFTPTAVNATVYAMQIADKDGKVVASAEYLSDGSATATEIVTGLKAALGTVPGVTLSGTATLIMTSSVAGQPFTATSTGDGVLSSAATQANVASAAPCPGCYYGSTATKGTLAILNVNLEGS